MSGTTSSDRRVIEAVKAMADRWSEEALVFLDGEDHEAFATAAVIGACIQIARCFIRDDDPDDRAYWVRMLATEGVDVDERAAQ